MRLFDLFENENTNLVVIYPGRFHPFHVGHGKVFKYLRQQYKGAKVYIASSGKTDAHKSPFEFNEKKKMMMLAGVDPNAVVQTRIPYVASEITDRFDPDNTIVVYAVSEKDMSEDPRFDFPMNGPKLKKNGEPAHVQKWTGVADAKPLRDHSYITTVPTFTFKIRGEAVNSATQIRNMIAKANEQELVQILQDLYGRSDIPQDVVEIFKRKLGSDTVSENWEEDSLFECLLEVEIMWDMNILTEDETKDADLGFDPKTVNALKNLKMKYPHADNVVAALVADVEDSQIVSKKNDTEHDIGIADLEQKVQALTKELEQLKMKKESTMKITDIVSEEITLEDHEDFHENFGYLAFCEEGLFEAEYQGRDVKLNKPMRGDVKKFKVYVKNDKGNVVKVNFGDPDMRIKKSNPARRKSFRARHNCDNPGPKTKARYWSCRKW